MKIQVTHPRRYRSAEEANATNQRPMEAQLESRSQASWGRGGDGPSQDIRAYVTREPSDKAHLHHAYTRMWHVHIVGKLRMSCAENNA